ncbi:MAG: 2-dehydropantoate 2-reductase [Solibacterales bacterium]|nr:2-dehydropantoate 2-reductase [Bryobacterales bacterium]|tara:strand:- start:21629 stop:22594 length:966 start_codon:yes stop_codon:yes gene_type:complete
MKFAIYGAGAIGGFLGARLHRAGVDISLIARGAHLEAIQTTGLHVRSKVVGDSCSNIPATSDPADIGQVDAIVLAVKSHAITTIAPKLAPLLSPTTVVVTTQNGIPWWYFHGTAGSLTDTHLESVDPGGVIAESIDAKQVVGCLAYCSASIGDPGVIEHLEGVRFPLGEPDGSRSDRIKHLANIFERAGLKAPIRRNIRHDVWVKILGNAAFNPLSVLTRLTLGEMVSDPPTRELARTVMEEITQIAAGVGVKIKISPEKRIEAIARQAGDHKTSMLQDVEAGRPIEIEAIVGAVIELADKAGVAAPKIRELYNRVLSISH